MEPQLGDQPQSVATPATEPWHAPLNRVTTVSKILAAVVFIMLPFVGFWLGVEYSSSEQVASILVSPPERAVDNQSVGVEGGASIKAIATTTSPDSVFWQDVQMAISDPKWSRLATLYQGDEDGFRCEPTYLYRQIMGSDSDIDQAESIPFRQLVEKISPTFVFGDGTQAVIMPCASYSRNTSELLVLFNDEGYQPLQFPYVVSKIGGLASGEYTAMNLYFENGLFISPERDVDSVYVAKYKLFEHSPYSKRKELLLVKEEYISNLTGSDPGEITVLFDANLISSGH